MKESFCYFWCSNCQREFKMENVYHGVGPSDYTSRWVPCECGQKTPEVARELDTKGGYLEIPFPPLSTEHLDN